MYFKKMYLTEICIYSMGYALSQAMSELTSPFIQPANPCQSWSILLSNKPTHAHAGQFFQPIHARAILTRAILTCPCSSWSSLSTHARLG